MDIIIIDFILVWFVSLMLSKDIFKFFNRNNSSKSECNFSQYRISNYIFAGTVSICYCLVKWLGIMPDDMFNFFIVIVLIMGFIISKYSPK